MTADDPLPSVPAELAELIRISREVGADPDWVQGGGGNTSVKSADGRTLFVKASGTALGAMDATRGWAELDLAATRALTATPGLAALDEKRREEQVLALLRAAARRPAGVRPSVEASLHALLDRVVIHTHPVQLTAFLAARDARSRWRELLAEVEGVPALYVDYVDPGYGLARAVEQAIGAFQRDEGRRPQILLLENHGLIVAAPTGDECLALQRSIAGLGARWAGRPRVNGLDPDPSPANAAAEVDLLLQVRGALRRGGTAPLRLRRDRSRIAAELVTAERVAAERGDAAFLASAARGAFTPDLIVYCRTEPLTLTGDDVAAWTAAVAAYRARHGLDPRVVRLPGRALFHAAPDDAALAVVTETHRVAITVLLASGRAGGPRPLDDRSIRFIEEWEVERFRAAVAAGSGGELHGRVVLVVNDGKARAADESSAWHAAFTAARATVVQVAAAAANAAAIGAAIDRGGGLDAIVDLAGAAGREGEALLAPFGVQSAGGAIVRATPPPPEFVARAGSAGVRVIVATTPSSAVAALAAIP